MCVVCFHRIFLGVVEEVSVLLGVVLFDFWNANVMFICVGQGFVTSLSACSHQSQCAVVPIGWVSGFLYF